MSKEENRIVIPRGELLKLSAVDSGFYCRHFFPKTFRQDSPDFHIDFWNKFEDTDHDYFAAEMFRGSAKTTLTRAGISKRIAFGVSRNILAVSISETMAIPTIRWLKKQIENNTYWTETFLLRKGDKWSDDWIEIINIPLDMRINVLAKGMTSGLRGLNLDDWRPDFITCDDICNEENTKTEEQRNKTNELIFGALAPSLSPKSEAPLRKFVLLQTGLHKDDAVNLAHRDPTFLTVKYPKIVEEFGVPKSAWEQRFPIEECLKEKDDYIRRGQLHVYLREFGCKIVSRETAPLPDTYLRYYNTLPTNLQYYIGLDPATDSQNKKAHKTAIAVIGVAKTGDVYLVDYFSQRGKNPDEMWVYLLNRYLTYRPRIVGVETIAFQKMLAWYFRKKMEEDKIFFNISEIKDKRSKSDRIIQAYSGLGSTGKFWVSPNHTDFIAGFTEWVEGTDWDLGDAGAQAIVVANPWMARGNLGDDEVEDAIVEEEKEYPELVYDGGAP